MLVDQQHHALNRSFAYLGWTLGVCAAVAGALALDTLHDVTLGWAAASLGVSLTLLVATLMGRDTFRISTLRILLTGFAASEGVFFGHVAEAAQLPLLAAALGVGALVFITMALWGLVTGHDLTGLGAFLFWSLVALLGVLIVGAMFSAAVVILVGAAAGVVLFALYTAHDVQWIVNESARAVDAETVERIAIEGSIALYLDLANLVTDVLSLFDWFSA